MKQLIRFAKAEATGNDFVVVDAAELDLDRVGPETIKRLCDRHFGVGGDGAIMIREDSDSDFIFDYYNADGYKSTMCGNGSRAAVLTANVFGYVKRNQELFFKAPDGIHRARIESNDRIRVEILTDNRPEMFDHDPFGLPGEMQPVAFLNTGVPHLVIQAERDIEMIDVATIGSRLRHESRFPEGTNVNFVQVCEDRSIKIRTYERGVEAETLACGTGVTASALALWTQTAAAGNRRCVETRGGLIQVIRDAGSVFIEGPARVVFVGEYLLN